MSSAPRVCVAGIGATDPVPDDPRSIPEMVMGAVDRALADAAMGHADIDAVVTASVDLFDGLTASNIAITEVVGAVGKPETRIASDGLCALAQALCSVRAGAYRSVLVVAHGKPSMASHDRLSEWTIDPVHLQPLGVDDRVLAGLQACLVADLDPRGALERWAQRAAALSSAAGTPRTAGDVLASPLLAAPLREAMRAPQADSACALVLRAKEGEEEAAITLAGVGLDLSPHHPGARDLGRWAGLERASARAYGGAGIADPSSAFTLLEPSCRYAHEEELFLDASGTRGDAALCPQGGVFGGWTPIAAGLGRAVAATRSLRAAGGGRALCHGTWGSAGQGQVVAILESASPPPGAPA